MDEKIKSDRLKYFNDVEDKFVIIFESLPLSAVNIGLVDNKESIIVFVYISEETPVYLPSGGSLKRVESRDHSKIFVTLYHTPLLSTFIKYSEDLEF
jgi:hypothetical protein